MRVLVTGGAGFIGSHLAQALGARGCAVRVLDDLSTGSLRNLSRGIELLRGDVRRRVDVARAVRGVDLVYHLAAAVGPGLVARDPGGTRSRNVGGTATVLRACRRRGIPMLFASSSEVYLPRPRGEERPFVESDPVGVTPGDRRAVYAGSKRIGERLVLRASHRDGLPAWVVRLFNVVGPGQSAREGMVLARFARAVTRRRPFQIYGDGLQRRCFLHVADAVRALLALTGTPEARGRIVNVGSDEEVSVRGLAHRVARLAGFHPGMQFVPTERVYGPNFGDPRQRRPDVRLLRSLTDWRRRLGLDDAIAQALARSMHEARFVASTSRGLNTTCAPPARLGQAPAVSSCGSGGVSMSAPKLSARARSTQ